VSQFPKFPIQDMSPFKKRQDRRGTPSKFGARSRESGIKPDLNQGSFKDFNGIVPPSSGHVDFRQIQVQLRFIALQT